MCAFFSLLFVCVFLTENLKKKIFTRTIWQEISEDFSKITKGNQCGNRRQSFYNLLEIFWKSRKSLGNHEDTRHEKYNCLKVIMWWKNVGCYFLI